ncbi:hypothetical protein A2230_03100 [candidate division WOR-1 bacterium RIFOXYA2_FULL_36_21]|uniref:Uncharacterized protein n=1 Tax=candidate division WOR-1 bacterium RIFOXYB2_FULL_36_35 TaxID=1802578 RepID=A0A1F4S0Z8_UNCSA|nr:MAG: hypothetical protein A2230_03100 [candidate division WOR-1 bacterium RIFOXYA2_FULL_36_21]OGC14067.1 MAG: hypothetical protein A2290_07025 [candidate division WOR-1 bacterium RIFOXYB2_FULL_36_35]OGC16756.1 MAG: hypothetical protein A2282_04060 [candidate division WOR-1 bacterium RIFOXYA12_FULL_36_13]
MKTVCLPEESGISALRYCQRRATSRATTNPAFSALYGFRFIPRNSYAPKFWSENKSSLSEAEIIELVENGIVAHKEFYVVLRFAGKPNHSSVCSVSFARIEIVPIIFDPPVAGYLDFSIDGDYNIATIDCSLDVLIDQQGFTEKAQTKIGIENIEKYYDNGTRSNVAFWVEDTFRTRLYMKERLSHILMSTCVQLCRGINIVEIHLEDVRNIGFYERNFGAIAKPSMFLSGLPFMISI